MKNIFLTVLLIIVGVAVFTAALTALYMFLYSQYDWFPRLEIVLQGAFSLSLFISVLITLFFIYKVAKKPLGLLITGFISLVVVCTGFGLFSGIYFVPAHETTIEKPFKNELFRFSSFAVTVYQHENPALIASEQDDIKQADWEADMYSREYYESKPESENTFLIDLLETGFLFSRLYYKPLLDISFITNMATSILLLICCWTAVRFTSWPLFNFFLALAISYGILFLYDIFWDLDIQAALEKVFQPAFFQFIPGMFFGFLSLILIMLNLMKKPLALVKAEAVNE